jgi:hypothetical protein
MGTRRPENVERDQQTLQASRDLRKAMENIEYDFFKRGTATWDQVIAARDEYLVAWEDRRNFVLADKYGMTEAEFDLKTAQTDEELAVLKSAQVSGAIKETFDGTGESVEVNWG